MPAPAGVEDRAERREVAPVGKDGNRGEQTSFAQFIERIAQRDCKMQHNARIPVAIRHTSRAAVADELASIEFPNGANRCPPIFTAPQIVIPIHIKILVPAVADKTLGLAMQTLLPVGDGGAWILQRKERAQ